MRAFPKILTLVVGAAGSFAAIIHYIACSTLVENGFPGKEHPGKGGGLRGMTRTPAIAPGALR